MNLPLLFDVFEHDNGLAMPELKPESKWVLENAATMITIKINGELIRINDSGKPLRLLPSAEGKFEVLASEAFPADRFVLEAYKNYMHGVGNQSLSAGYYVAFGPDIKGNPMGAEEPYMLCVSPMTTGSLIVQRCMTGLKMAEPKNVTAFYESVKRELEESPDIEGLVFLLEESIYKPLAWAQVRRQEFGLPWPAPKDPLTVAEAISSGIYD